MKLGPSLWGLALVATLALPVAAQVDPETEADRCFGCADPISLVQCVAAVEEYRRGHKIYQALYPALKVVK